MKLKPCLITLSGGPAFRFGSIHVLVYFSLLFRMLVLDFWGHGKNLKICSKQACTGEQDTDLEELKLAQRRS